MGRKILQEPEVRGPKAETALEQAGSKSAGSKKIQGWPSATCRAPVEKDPPAAACLRPVPDQGDRTPNLPPLRPLQERLGLRLGGRLGPSGAPAGRALPLIPQAASVHPGRSYTPPRGGLPWALHNGNFRERRSGNANARSFAQTFGESCRAGHLPGPAGFRKRLLDDFLD